jgi:hypothetical protein
MILPVRKKAKLMVMVVDMYASRILSSCCRMYDVTEAGVVGTSVWCLLKPKPQRQHSTAQQQQQQQHQRTTTALVINAYSSAHRVLFYSLSFLLCGV